MGQRNHRMIENGNPVDINIKEYFNVIKKRFWIIAVITILATLAGYFYSSHNYTPLYQSSTRMILGSGDQDMNTLMVMIKDPIIMEKVRQELQLDKSAEAIASQIEVTRIDDSQVVNISVTDTNYEAAADIANATAASYKSEIVSILGFSEVQLLSEAKENPFAINETQNRTTIIALVFGLVVSIGLVFLLDSLDGKVRKDREIEGILGVPVLGIVSNMNKVKGSARRRKQKDINLRGEIVDI
ncbi:YveK family protein [Oceanobacillus chungangensis]|uniref:Capsular biosynthesis protein n=1 Tax=Oceanobacillus chungangensis TaxID=1229152 RepID=A0A3D8PXX3_9BACI|nr:Wzz/FepE/Etk N-terminal domain-containing protein [Oceanobacillus chungangensis]RDW20397.1 capsular biosynthesis protein [Oceanobacillus chungangensis]